MRLVSSTIRHLLGLFSLSISHAASSDYVANVVSHGGHTYVWLTGETSSYSNWSGSGPISLLAPGLGANYDFGAIGIAGTWYDSFSQRHGAVADVVEHRKLQVFASKYDHNQTMDCDFSFR